MQKHVNLVDLVKSFPTNIFLQNLASIQKRTSPLKFAHLAEKSEKGSISNLSTKLRARLRGVFEVAGLAGLRRRLRSPRNRWRTGSCRGPARGTGSPRSPFRASRSRPRKRPRGGSARLCNGRPLDQANFTGLVLGCIEAKFCK